MFNSSQCAEEESEEKKIGIIKHGESKTRLYNVWADMKQRCYDKNDPDYKKYGAKGIAVCDEWQEYIPFRDWALANGYDSEAPRGKTTIDRIDGSGDYSPENCRWVDYFIQNRNRKNSLLATMNGETKTISEWADQYGINRWTLRYRIVKMGLSIEEAIARGESNG